MKVMYLAAVAAASLSLAACNSTGYAYHDAVHAQATAVFLSPSVGAGIGHLGVTVDKSANVDKNGVAIVVHGGCKDDSPDTFANMSAKATASASSVTPAAMVAGASAGGLVSPSIAVAVGDETANGGAAIIAAASQTAHPADTIAAYCQNAQLPSAAPGQIVRDGVSPK